VQIVNYRSIGSTPLLLALGLAAGAIGALGLTLASSVRQRRRDLAMLKTLGFTRRQIAAAIAWQSTVDAVVGILIGVPLGVVAGRQLWTLFARTINAVPDPTVPVLSVALVAAGALLFTNVVAALPGRFAARIPIGLILRPSRRSLALEIGSGAWSLTELDAMVAVWSEVGGERVTLPGGRASLARLFRPLVRRPPRSSPRERERRSPFARTVGPRTQFQRRSPVDRVLARW
jgi:predicted lysophospholipase L1 biosynthesis ABC-type transport system permease subunit